MDEDPADTELQRHMLLSMIRAILGDQRYTYLSGPITTGRSFVDWQRRHGSAIADDDEWLRQRLQSVITPNCRALSAEAGRLRGGRQVIEPGSFEAGDRLWQQSDYYQLWDRVITRHASEVYFIEGWQFSAGCAFEYECALRNGRRILAGGVPLPVNAALGLIDDALRSLTDHDQRIRKLSDDIAVYREKIAEHGGASD